MSRLQEINKSLEQVRTISNISGVLEAVASIEISNIKQQVLKSKDFFEELWHLYTLLRKEGGSEFGSGKQGNGKQLYIVITGQGGLSGDIDERLINSMLKVYDPNTADIAVVGHHGAVKLAQREEKIVKYFNMPAKTNDIELSSMIELINQYSSATAFYQTYISLSDQQVRQISLQAAVKGLMTESSSEDELITQRNYIFEPSSQEVIAYLESTMLGIALGQIILESKLAQQASRFKAMSVAHDKSKENLKELKLDYNRAKRMMSDERIKEVINGLKNLGARANG